MKIVFPIQSFENKFRREHKYLIIQIENALLVLYFSAVVWFKQEIIWPILQTAQLAADHFGTWVRQVKTGNSSLSLKHSIKPFHSMF